MLSWELCCCIQFIGRRQILIALQQHNSKPAKSKTTARVVVVVVIIISRLATISLANNRPSVRLSSDCDDDSNQRAANINLMLLAGTVARSRFVCSVCVCVRYSAAAADNNQRLLVSDDRSSSRYTNKLCCCCCCSRTKAKRDKIWQPDQEKGSQIYLMLWPDQQCFWRRRRRQLNSDDDKNDYHVPARLSSRGADIDFDSELMSADWLSSKDNNNNQRF